MKIAVLGAKGFLGSEIVSVLGEDYSVVPITRDNYSNHKGEHFDVFINVAGNKFNYWANQFPNEDFRVSTMPVYDSLFDFKIDKYIFMSSIATYDDNSIYGFNKILSEQIIIRHSADYLILRCCSVIDTGEDKGLVADILNNRPLFVSADSEIQFITRHALVDLIQRLIITKIKKESFNVGGQGAARIGDIENITNNTILYEQTAQYRHYEMDVSELAKIVSLKTSHEYVEEIVRKEMCINES
jgi:nucleoside-diphosphate-sugar epimerase